MDLAMKIVANSRRVYIGGWLALALALLAANLLKLGQLEFQPLAGSPAVINQLRRHLLQFDELMSVRGINSELRLDAPIVRTRLPQTTGLSPLAASARSDEKMTPLRTPLLPQLTGILQVVHDTGARHYYAVLDGNVYAAKDSIAELRIEEISATGIVLRQRDQRWFLPAPEVYFSIGQSP
jgi:hypothetical protein